MAGVLRGVEAVDFGVAARVGETLVRTVSTL